MNKLLNNLENKLKDVEQDITSLQASNSCENESKGKKKYCCITYCIICAKIDLKEGRKKDIENDIFQVKQLKRDLENDEKIQDVLKSFESFKENLSFTYDDRLE